MRLNSDGSLRYQRTVARNLRIYSRALESFDDNGNLRWAAPVLAASVELMTKEDPYYHDVPIVAGVNEASFPMTTDGSLVTFNPGGSAGFHLGSIRPGAQQWSWRASHSGSWTLDQSGAPVALDGSFELGRGVQYAGNTAVTAGPHIIYGYHGEAWNGGQANQWMHYYDNGLFVGQFGRPVYVATNQRAALPETAGNAFSPQLVTVGGVLYLWHNDESAHSGIHRWRIDGADQIRIQRAAIQR
jgi:hypothetical protein